VNTQPESAGHPGSIHRQFGSWNSRAAVSFHCLPGYSLPTQGVYLRSGLYGPSNGIRRTWPTWIRSGSLILSRLAVNSRGHKLPSL
jgi:hypothetical protein